MLDSAAQRGSRRDAILDVDGALATPFEIAVACGVIISSLLKQIKNQSIAVHGGISRAKYALNEVTTKPARRGMDESSTIHTTRVYASKPHILRIQTVTTPSQETKVDRSVLEPPCEQRELSSPNAKRAANMRSWVTEQWRASHVAETDSSSRDTQGSVRQSCYGPRNMVLSDRWYDEWWHFCWELDSVPQPPDAE